MVVRDLARVNEIEFAEANKLAKMIPEELNISLDDAVTKSPGTTTGSSKPSRTEHCRSGPDHRGHGPQH